MEKNIASLNQEWKDAFDSCNDKKMYSLLLQVFKQYLPLMTKKNPPTEGWQLIEVLQPILLNVVEKHYEKSAKIREVLTQFYDSTFNVAPSESALIAEMSEDGSIKKNDLPIADQFNSIKSKKSQNLQQIPKIRESFDPLHLVPSTQPHAINDVQNVSSSEALNSLESSMKRSDLEESESSETEKCQVVPPDAQGSEYFKAQIQKLVAENLGHLYSVVDFYPDQDKSAFLSIISHLIDVFPDSPGILIPKIQKSMETGILTADQFKILFKKCIDKDPSAIVFSTFTNLQEKMLDTKLTPQELRFFEAVFDVIAEYIQYYPDFFSNQINLYVGLLGKYNDNITELVAKIIIFYANNGEERVEELFFEIFEKLELLSESTLNSMIHALHDSLDGNRTFILEKHFKNDRFDKDILRSVYKRFKHPVKGIQELAFEIAIALWNFNTHVHILHQESQNEILKSIYLILKQLNSLKVYSPYILMQAIRDVDNLIHELNSNHPDHLLENLLITEKNLENPAQYFTTLQLFLKKIKEIE